MAVIPPTPVDLLPEPYPQRGDRATFSDRVDDLVTWWETSPPQVNDIAENVYHNATEAAASATAAAASAVASDASADAAAASAVASDASADAAAISAAQAAASASGVQQAAGGAVAFYYVFSTTTADADPGAGNLRLNNATQNLSTVIRTDLSDRFGSDMSALLDTLDDSTSTVKGQFRLSKQGDMTKWLTFNLTATASPAGYRNFTVAVTASSGANPFADGDNLVLAWSRTGDKGERGQSTVTSVTDSVTLTAANIGYVSCAVTARGKAVTLPDATTLVIANPLATVSNALGEYAVGIRNSVGALLGVVEPGGEAFVSLKDNSSAAGVWSLGGSGLAPGWIISDQTFSSAFSSSANTRHVDFDGNKSLHFVTNGSSLQAVCFNGTTGEIGTPVTLDTSAIPIAAFRRTATEAILFYRTGANDKAICISLSGSTTLTPGTAVSTTLNTFCRDEDWLNQPMIQQLAPDLYASVWNNTGTTRYNCQACSVSGSTPSFGTVLDFNPGVGSVGAPTMHALTATTAAVVYKSGGAAPYNINSRVITVTGNTCAAGTEQALTGLTSSTTGAPSSAKLSATKIIVADDNNTTAVLANTFTISGTSVAAGTALSVEGSMATGLALYTANGANRYIPHLTALGANKVSLWYVHGDISRNVILDESGGVLTPGAIAYRAFTGAAALAAGNGNPLPQGTTSFSSVQLSRSNADGGFLQAKAYKINGNVITPGTSKPLLSMSMGLAQIIGARLPNGDNVLVSALNNGGSVADTVQAALPVWRTNGDQINYRGDIQLPPATWCVASGSTPAWPVQTVGNNRLVLFGATQVGQVGGLSTRLLRAIAVELTV